MRSPASDFNDKIAVCQRSTIHGIGVFARRVISRGDVISSTTLAHLHNFRGFNHSCEPNIVLARLAHGDVLSVATRRIEKGEELTVFYTTGSNDNLFDVLSERDLKRCKCPIHRE